MKPTFLSSLLAIAMLAWGSTSQAQDCSTEVLAILTTQMWGGEISYTISDDNGVLVSGQDFGDFSTYTELFCVDNVEGCLVLEMTDSFGDGWNGAMAELFVDGESAGTMALEEGDYELRVVGVGMDCETPDNGGDGDGTASLGDPSASEWSLELFPNPGQDQLTIRSQQSGTEAAPTVVVFNADGRMVMDATNDARGVDGDWIIDATSWTPGMYIVHVTQLGTTRQLPWIKVR
ncbi:MAG: T9SS type A sorting domain-containing protein [Flavobacteriales bacterium]